MKVLVIGSGSGLWVGGKQMLILEHLREAGYEIVHKTPEELEAERPKALIMSGEMNWYWEECSKIPNAFFLTEPKPKYQPKGPRGRWGKVK